MATLCKNCGSPLIFDPAIQKVRCEQCGSTFLAEEVESTAKEFIHDKQAVSMEEVYGGVTSEYLDCYVYTCSECGGEIIINGSEASTKCIYCGNSSVVFSRIDKELSPEFIIPFSITKEQAIENIRKELKKGLFIPKEIKNFTVENVRGIYVPYWLVSGEHSGSVVISTRVSHGKHTETEYYGRAGRMRFSNIPLDGSIMLSDDSCAKLEPFDLSALKMFDEDYLLGFYSNVSDLTNKDLHEAADRRAYDMFCEIAMEDVKRGSDKKIISGFPCTEIEYDTKYAMFPIWFVTFDYQGRHNTILVNGQTGKVVCALPWNKGLFSAGIGILGAILTALFSPIFYNLVIAPSSGSSNSKGKLILYAIAGGIGLIALALGRVKKVTDNINLTQSAKTFNFMKKRQE